jgi:hypothetical protein
MAPTVRITATAVNTTANREPCSLNTTFLLCVFTRGDGRIHIVVHNAGQRWLNRSLHRTNPVARSGRRRAVEQRQ